MSLLEDDALAPLFTAYKAQRPGPQARPEPTLSGDALRDLGVRATQPGMPADARRAGAAVLTWFLPDPVITAHLTGLLSDPEPTVRVYAATGLGPEVPGARATLEQWLRVEEPGARLDLEERKVAKTALLERLEPLYDVGAPAAFDTWYWVGGTFPLHRDDGLTEEVMELSILGLGCIHFHPELWELLGTCGWDCRKENLATALGGHTDERSFQLLLKAYAAQEDGCHTEAWARLGILEGLSQRGDVRALPFLRAELERQSTLDYDEHDGDLVTAAQATIAVLEAIAAGGPPPSREWTYSGEHWSSGFSTPRAAPEPPAAPWTAAPTCPAPATTPPAGWVWQEPRIEADDAPRGWEQAPVVATLRGFRLRWAGLDASDACLEQLAYCSEEDLYGDWMDREPESPFLLDGAVNPVWTAWLLEEVHRRLGSRVPRSEVERWLAYMVFEVSETHRALKARFAAD